MCCYLPDSWLAPLIARLEREASLRTVSVCNEGEGVAICAGMWLGGKRSVMLMENSGLRMACEELARLGLGQGIPVLMILSYRGDLGDKDSWAQPHGWTMLPILEALRVTHRILRTEADVRQAIPAAVDTMVASNQHVALILGRELCA